MKNEIKVGDLIRDREGHITKIIQTLSLFKDVELYLGEDGYQYSDNAIVKHSPNIIDLIKIGDVIKILDIEYSYIKIFDINNKDMLKNLEINFQSGKMKLLSVVTKEQFITCEYRLEE